MSADIAAQLAALWQGAALGAAMGLLYDLFRVLRRRVRVPLLGPVLDLIFWCAATAWKMNQRRFGSLRTPCRSIP